MTGPPSSPSCWAVNSTRAISSPRRSVGKRRTSRSSRFCRALWCVSPVHALAVVQGELIQGSLGRWPVRDGLGRRAQVRGRGPRRRRHRRDSLCFGSQAHLVLRGISCFHRPAGELTASGLAGTAYMRRMARRSGSARSSASDLRTLPVPRRLDKALLQLLLDLPRLLAAHRHGRPFFRSLSSSLADASFEWFQSLLLAIEEQDIGNVRQAWLV